MNLTVVTPGWVVLALLGLLLLAAVQDAVQLRISNLICLAVLLLAFLAALVAGPEWSLWQNLLLLAIALAVGTWLFALGLVGGGNAKLLAATILWFDLGGALVFVTATALAGAALAVLVVALRRIRWSEGVRARMPVLAAGAAIPYGIALAAGAAAAILVLQPTSGVLDGVRGASALPAG